MLPAGFQSRRRPPGCFGNRRYLARPDAGIAIAGCPIIPPSAGSGSASDPVLPATPTCRPPLTAAMTTASRYPNRDAIRRALDIYIDAMRPFVVRCLRPTSAEGLRAAIVSYLNPGQQQNFADAIARNGGNIPAAIDIGILRTLINAAWFDHFRSEFKYTDTVRSAVNFITETRNEESHMGLGDHDAGRAYVCLYHITTVLKHTGNTDACRAVADLMTQIAPQRRPASSPASPAAANTDTAADTDIDTDASASASADPPSAVSPADLAQALRQAETREAEARQAVAQAEAREQAAHHAVRQMETRAAETETRRQDAEQAIAQADARAQTAEQAIAKTETRRQDAEQAIAQADARAQTAEQAIRTAQERANAADAREHAARQALEQAEARETEARQAIAAADARAAEARQAIAEAQTREQDAEQAIAEAEAYEQDVEQAIRAADERAQAAIRALRQAETREAEARHAIARANTLRQDAEQTLRTVAARTPVPGTPVPGTLAPGTPEPARAAVAASHPATTAVAVADVPASAAPAAPRTDALLPPDAPMPPPSPAALPRCWQAVLDDLSRTRGQKYYLGAVLKDCPPPAVRIVGDYAPGAGDRNSGSDRPTLILPFASRPGLYRMLEELSLSHCGGVIASAIAANFGAPCAFAITLQNETPQREYYRYTP